MELEQNPSYDQDLDDDEADGDDTIATSPKHLKGNTKDFDEEGSTTSTSDLTKVWTLPHFHQSPVNSVVDKINTRNSSSKQEVKIKQPKNNYHWNFTIPKANGSGLTNNKKRVVLGSMFLNKLFFVIFACVNLLISI